VAIKRCKPVQLTIDRDESSADSHYSQIVKTPLSGQFG
jgi:hypothetical protein